MRKKSLHYRSVISQLKAGESTYLNVNEKLEYVFKKLMPFKVNQTKLSCDELQLITGSFTPAEAEDVLLYLINHKIKFHST